MKFSICLDRPAKVLHRFGLAALLLGGLALSAPARAQQSIDVTFISGVPPAATWINAFVNDYTKAVDAALSKQGKYRINWNLAHSGQIAKVRGEIDALEGGLGDMAVIPTFLHFDRLPLYELPYATPFTTDDPTVLADVFGSMEERFPQFKQQWEEYNQVLLATTPVVDNYIVISKKPLQTLADFEGLKIGAISTNMVWFSSVGATPVQSNVTDWFTSLNTGLYDAANAWPQALAGFKLCQAARHMLDARIGANAPMSLTANLDFWKRLPEEVRKAFSDAAPLYNKAQIRLLTEGASSAVDSCRQQFGMDVVRMSPEERVEWARSLPSLAKDWAAQMERQKLPGDELLRAYMDEMRERQQPIARQWDRE